MGSLTLDGTHDTKECGRKPKKLKRGWRMGKCSWASTERCEKEASAAVPFLVRVCLCVMLFVVSYVIRPFSPPPNK